MSNTYPGDTRYIYLPITLATGVNPNVTATPVVTIIRLSDSTTIVSAQTMTLVTGTQAVYVYPWSIASNALSGDYLAIASWTNDGITYNSRPILPELIHVGDTYITGPVALSATVALNATVAKDATVAHASDLAAVNPNNSSLVQSIAAKTANLPSDPAGMTLLATPIQHIQDTYDGVLGPMAVDKTQNPPVITITRVGGGTLATYTIADSTNSSIKTKTS